VCVMSVVLQELIEMRKKGWVAHGDQGYQHLSAVLGKYHGTSQQCCESPSITLCPVFPASRAVHSAGLIEPAIRKKKISTISVQSCHDSLRSELLMMNACCRCMVAIVNNAPFMYGQAAGSFQIA
jgi:hypothetical protein